MIYGIAELISPDEGLYGWDLLDDRIFTSKEEAVDYAKKDIDLKNWEGRVTLEDAETWIWNRTGNDSDMGDLCLVCSDDRKSLIRFVQNLG